MIDTYKWLANFAQTWGPALLLDGIRAGGCLRRSGRRTGRDLTTQRACRCGRIETWQGTISRRLTNSPAGDDRSRVGRHPRTQHAATALVALHLLRHDCPGRSATGSSIRPGHWSPPSTTGTFQWNARSEVAGDLEALKVKRGRDDGEDFRRQVWKTSTAIRRRWRSLVPSAARPWRQLRAVPRAAAGPALKDMRISSTTTGCGAASWRTSRPRSGTACGRSTPTDGRAACRLLGRDGMLQRPRHRSRRRSRTATCEPAGQFRREPGAGRQGVRGEFVRHVMAMTPRVSATSVRRT